jgi:hypothetical protein
MFFLGNEEILKLHKTAFLCSRTYPSSIVLKAYDWAIALRDSGKCVISGFHSQIEKDVFHYLIKGTQPIILALARGLPKRLDPALKPHVDSGRLLLATPFSMKTNRITELTCFKRNQMILEIADEVIVGFSAKESTLFNLLKESCKSIKFL